MGDVNEADVVFVLKAQKHVNYVHSERRVDHADGFIGDNQLRAWDQAACNGDALKFAAGELIGISAADSPKWYNNNRMSRFALPAASTPLMWDESDLIALRTSTDSPIRSHQT